MGKGIPIHVLGTSFTIQTDESPEYVQKLVDYVTQKISELERSLPTRDTIRLAVLASVLIADELFKERANPASPTVDSAAANIADTMIAKIDRALEIDKTGA